MVKRRIVHLVAYLLGVEIRTGAVCTGRPITPAYTDRFIVDD